MERGRWYFPDSMPYIDSEGRRFDLTKELFDGEMQTFPKARFDDMLDALTRIYDAEMMAVFPKPKKASYYKEAGSDSWVDW